MRVRYNYIVFMLMLLQSSWGFAQYTPDRYNVPIGGGGSRANDKKVTYRYFVEAQLGYDIAKFAGLGTTTNFSGFSYGGSVEPHFYLGSFSLGAHLAILKSSLQNAANTSTRSESIDSTDIQLTLRSQSGVLLFGVGPAIRFFTLNSTNAGTLTTTKYGAFGMRFELGMRFIFGSYFTVTPVLQYETLWANPSDNSGQRRVNTYMPKIGIGISF